VKSFYLVVLVIFAGVFTSGCSSNSVKKEAFAKPPKLAVVSVYGTANDLFTNGAEDAKIVADTAPACMEELRKSRNVRIVPLSSVLSAKSYAAIKNNPSSYFQQLPGYKKFTPQDEKNNLQALAKELHVDGFLILEVAYSRYKSAGLGIGPIGFSSEKPLASVVVSVFNPAMEVLWFDNARQSPEDGSFGFSFVGLTATDYPKMISQLKGLTVLACQQAVKDLSDMLAKQ
jgi:hypothetical protein